MLYRYEFESGCKYPHTGIILGIDDIFDDINDNLLDTSLFFKNNLKAPIVCHEPDKNITFYFTEEGNQKFNKCVNTIKTEAAKLNINIIRLELDRDIINNIYYEDEYQVVIDDFYIDKSKICKV